MNIFVNAYCTLHGICIEQNWKLLQYMPVYLHLKAQEYVSFKKMQAPIYNADYDKLSVSSII